MFNGKTWKKKRKEKIVNWHWDDFWFQHWNNLRISHWILLAGPVRSTQRVRGDVLTCSKASSRSTSSRRDLTKHPSEEEMCHYIVFVVVGKFHQHYQKKSQMIPWPSVTVIFPLMSLPLVSYPTTTTTTSGFSLMRIPNSFDWWTNTRNIIQKNNIVATISKENETDPWCINRIKKKINQSRSSPAGFRVHGTNWYAVRRQTGFFFARGHTAIVTLYPEARKLIFVTRRTINASRKVLN